MQFENTRAEALSSGQARAASRPGLDWAVALGSLWLIIGLHLDGWAHHHMAIESFFTPWHAVLYSGFGVTAAAVGLAFLDGIRRGQNWRAALPRAYQASLLGAIIFLVGGLVDMTWHTLFGTEVSLEALLSPPHLVLALGAGLLMTGPLRAALYRKDLGRHPPGIPALLSLAMLLALLGFFSEYANPWFELTERVAGTFAFQVNPFDQAQLITGIMLQSAVLMGGILLLVRRFRLPFGTLALLFSLLTALAASAHTNWGLIPVAALGGLAGDGLVLLLRPGERDWGTRLFAFLTPALLYALFFGALILSGGLDWSMELWGGAILLAGFVGWLLSYGFLPGETVSDEPNRR